MTHSTRGTGVKRKKRNKTLYIIRLFIKTFLVSIGAFCVVLGIGALLFFSIAGAIVRPPDIPVPPGFESNLSLNDSTESFGPTTPERFTEEDRRELFFTFLIIGLNEGTNANTIMVASFDGIRGEANLISIPRDSLMNVDRRIRKLSGSYMAGALGGRGRAGGVAQMQREVMSIIGFVPDFYVVLDYDAFFAIIDAVGGIEMYVPFHMRYDDPLQNLHIDIPPGLQHMNSQTALHFARFRMSNPGFRSITDYQRIENQQAVINAVISELLSPASLLRIPEFVGVFNDSVYTNLTIGNMLWFANQLNNIRGTDALSTHIMPTTGTTGPPMWYELLDPPAIVELVNQTINPYYSEVELRDLSIITE